MHLTGFVFPQMKICHVITRLIVGGAQENTLLTCEGLHALGHDVTLLAGPTVGPEGSLVERARAGGYRFIELPSLVREVSPIQDVRALFDVRRFFCEQRPDVVHTHSSKAGIVVRLAAAEAGVPTIIHTVHGMSFNRTQPRAVQALYAELERLAGRFTHRMICVADAMRLACLDAGLASPDRCITIYSGMDVSVFDPARVDGRARRTALGIGPDEIVVVTVARLFRNKGYEWLIPAMARAAAVEPRLRYLWIGDGADRSVYEAELRHLGLRDRTILAGLVPPGEIPDWLAAADLLVHSSVWEGLPRAVVQALFMQRPAVAFDLDGAPEVIRHGETGLLVAPRDVAGLADAIVELALDPALREKMGRAGREQCLVRFDHRRMVEAIDRVYREATHG